jgi:hypothetical protein
MSVDAQTVLDNALSGAESRGRTRERPRQETGVESRVGVEPRARARTRTATATQQDVGQIFDIGTPGTPSQTFTGETTTTNVPSDPNGGIRTPPPELPGGSGSGTGSSGFWSSEDTFSSGIISAVFERQDRERREREEDDEGGWGVDFDSLF